jgi:hypothetical protein
MPITKLIPTYDQQAEHFGLFWPGKVGAMGGRAARREPTGSSAPAPESAVPPAANVPLPRVSIAVRTPSWYLAILRDTPRSLGCLER